MYVCMCVYIYMYIYISLSLYIYIYIYIGSWSLIPSVAGVGRLRRRPDPPGLLY